MIAVVEEEIALAAAGGAEERGGSPARQGSEVACRRLWERDSRLVNLLEIVKIFHPSWYLAAAGGWGRLSETIPRHSTQIVDAEMKVALSEPYLSLKQDCSAMGLVASVATIDKILALFAEEHPMVGKHSALGDELLARLTDEMRGTVFLSLSLQETQEYNKPRAGWEEVIDRFPSVVRDVEEASKCLALSRNTACVFHLMRIMESGLVVLGKKVGVRKKSPTWDAILGAVDRMLNPKPGVKKTGRWRKHEPWFAEANSMLRAVKIAWRNPTMHVTRSYDEEEAREVYATVKSFMSHLASKLKE